MARPILSISLIVIAVIVFFSFIDPVYKEIKDLRVESRQFDDALLNSKELQSTRDSLLSRYNTFSSEDLNRAEKFLPDNVDNVRLILDLDSIASTYGILIKNVSIDQKEKEVGETIEINKKIDEIELSFSITAPYDDFKDFMRDLEQSLRVVDIKELSFQSRENNRNLLDYDVTIKTYWLK